MKYRAETYEILLLKNKRDILCNRSDESIKIKLLNKIETVRKLILGINFAIKNEIEACEKSEKRFSIALNTCASIALTIFTGNSSGNSLGIRQTILSSKGLFRDFDKGVTTSFKVKSKGFAIELILVL